MNEHILALDIGDVRIGIAVSDGLRMIATPLEVWKRVGWGPDVRHISELCARYDTREVVSGLPLNMDGSAGFQAQKVQQFCAELEKAGLTVYYQDERLTTVTAENALLEDGMKRSGRKQTVDMVAAAVILQQWLDSRRNERLRAQGGPESEAMAMADDRDLFENEDDEAFSTDGVIELIDEDGNTVPFEHLDTIEHEGEYYIVLLPADEDEDDDDEGGVLIMQISKDENGEDCYLTLDDEEVMNAVFDKFLERMEDEEDYEIGPASDDGD